MSLEVFDGFDDYNPPSNWGSVAAVLVRHPGLPNNVTNYFSAAGRFGGSCLQTNQALFQPQSYFTDNLTSVSTRFVGFAFKSQNFSSQTQPWPIVSYLHGGVVQCYFGIDTGGHLYFQVGSTLVATSTSAMLVNTWYYLQFKVKVDPSTGTYDARVTDGGITSTWLTGTGNTANTGSANSDSIAIGGTNNSSNPTYIDDFYILNTSGSVNNDWLGESRIITVEPSGSGALTQLTSSNANPNYQNVNEGVVTDFDANYNYSSTTGQIDLYTYPPITPTGSIAAVQVMLAQRKDDVGTRATCVEYRHGSTNYDGANIFNPGSDYRMGLQIYETDPATSTPWVTANINSGQFGIKIVT